MPPDQNPDVAPQCAQSVDPAERDRRRRRRRRRYIIGLGIIGLVLAPALLFYAQSEHALIQIYLPMLSHRLGARVTATGGSVHFNGRIQLSNLKLAGTDGEPAIQVDKVNLKIQPSTLFGEALPTIDDLQLVNPRLRIRVDREGNSNLEYTRAANLQKIPDAPKKTQTAASSPRPLPSVRVGRLDVNHLALDYADAAGMRLVIDKLDFAIADLVPGKAGIIQLNLECLVERPGEGVRQEASLKAGGGLTQQSGGQAMDWTGSVELAVKSRLADTPTTQSITMNAKTEGSITAAGEWKQKIQLEAATPQGPAGHGEGDLVWDDARPLHRASLKIQGIGPQVLNPLLTPLARIQIVDARVDADFRVLEDAQGIHFDSSATADQVSFRLGEDPTPAGPMSLNLTQSGAFDPAKREVRWDAMDLTINPDVRQTDGVADRIKINGLCRVGNPPNLKLDVHVASFNADPYLDWLDRMGPTNNREDVEPTSKTASPMKEATSPDPEIDEKTRDTSGALIEADITIDQARYRQAALEQLVAKLREQNGVLDFQIERGKLCGGALTLHANADKTRPEPRYTWDASLNGADLTALMSIQDADTSAEAVETGTIQTHEEPAGRISTLLNAIASRAKNVVVDLSDMVGGGSPHPKRMTGTVSITSRGTGRGSDHNLLRSLESKSQFEIKDGEIEGFFVLDALAIATRIDTFRKLVFDRSAGTIETRDGTAAFEEVGASGAIQRVELTGRYDLVDHSYELELQPAIGASFLDRIANNPFMPHLIRDSQGYFSFPFQVSVKSDAAGRRRVMVFPKLPEGLVKMGGQVGETVRGAVGGVIDQSSGVIKESGGAIKESIGKINDSVGEGLSTLGKKLRGD